MKPFEVFTSVDVRKACEDATFATAGLGAKAYWSVFAEKLNGILNERGKRVFMCDEGSGEWQTSAGSTPCPACTDEALLLAERPIQEGKRDE